MRADNQRMNQLDALKQFTTVVADTGDFMQLAQFQPRDATTNPSLILKAVQKAEYAPLLAQTVERHRHRAMDDIKESVRELQFYRDKLFVTEVVNKTSQA